MLKDVDCDTAGRAYPGASFGTVLIVEDEGLLAMTMEDLVRQAGAAAVFVCRDPAQAVRVASEETLACAVLDVALRGELTYEVADALAGRGIPFLFCTGVDPEDIADRHRHRPLLAKPYSDAQFSAVLTQTLSG